MHVRRTGQRALVHTPAKINLFLEVLARRDDGFHEIETLMAAVSIFDTFTFEPHERESIEFNCRWAVGIEARARGLRQSSSDVTTAVPAGPENLAWRAIELLRHRAGERRGAKAMLLKRIPAAAGLGGASSDAAAALVAANLGWELGWSRERLAGLAAELGSDVPFFLTHGSAICRGRGERIEEVRVPRLHLVVVRPPIGLSTAEVYKHCRPPSQPERAELVLAATATGSAGEVARRMTNRLQQSAESLTPWISRLKTEFDNVDCLGHQMSGSGSSYFGICRHARQARRNTRRLRGRRIGVVHAAATAALA